VRPALPLALVALLAGCTAGTTGAAPAPSAGASTPAARALLVAATRETRDGIWLYRIGPDRVARHVATVPPPEPSSRASAITMSAGTTPSMCVIWSADGPGDDRLGVHAASCYDRLEDGLEPSGTPVPVAGQVDEIALDAEGTRLFWSTKSEDGDATGGVVADYDDGRTSGGRALDMDCSRYLLSVVWAGRDRLVLHCTSGDNDDPGFLMTHELGAGSWAPRPGHQVGEAETFVHPGFADETSVGAFERRCASGCDTAMPRMLSARAVRVDLRTGRVVEVVATPAEGRHLHTLTGGAHGVVYVTEGRTDTRVYLRWPGERRGTRVAGLPADLATLTAQA